MQEFFCIHWLKCRILSSQVMWIWWNYTWKSMGTNGWLLISKHLSTSYTASTLYSTDKHTFTHQIFSQFEAYVQTTVRCCWKYRFFLVHINFEYLKWSQTVLIHQYQLCLPALSRVSKYAPHLTFTQLFWLFIFSYKSWLLWCQCFLKLYNSRKGTKVETPISSTSPDVFCTGLGIYYMDILHYEQHASWKQQELHCLCFAEALLSETLLFLQVRVFQHKHAY